jgi:energy-coupling factor transport system ATP-binding protein
VLELNAIRFAHHGRSAVVDGLDLAVPPGEVHLLAGPSGSGKSTILRIAAGLIPRVQGGRFDGEARLDGQPVAEIPARELPNRVGWVPQDPEESFAARTVDRELGQLARNLGLDEPREATRQALRALGAEDLREREVEHLSGGEAARLSLAAAGLGSPDALLLDEPTAQLDRAGGRRVAKWIAQRRAEGTRVLAAEHRPHPLEADRVHELADEAPARPDVGLPEPERGRVVAGLEGATKRYDQARVGPLDLAVYPGEVVCLTGPNGCGKTTALHLLCGLLEPDDGQARLGEVSPDDLEPVEPARRVAIAFQHPAWHITQDTLAEEVVFTAERLDRSIDPDNELSRLGFTRYADEHPWDLSGGERQRLAVATAQAHDPPLLVLDEPTRGLDPASLDRLASLLRARVEAGKATIVASHHPWMQELAHRTIDLGGAAP